MWKYFGYRFVCFGIGGKGYDFYVGMGSDDLNEFGICVVRGIKNCDFMGYVRFFFYRLWWFILGVCVNFMGFLSVVMCRIK